MTVPRIIGDAYARFCQLFHLQLGSEYSWTILGKREPAPLPEADRTTPATIQLLFQFATEPESAKWPVRDLASSAGISKTRVA